MGIGLFSGNQMESGEHMDFRMPALPIFSAMSRRRSRRLLFCGRQITTRPAEAFKWIYSETIIRSWDSEFQKNIADLLTDLVMHEPVYMLKCLPDEEAVAVLKQKLENSQE